MAEEDAYVVSHRPWEHADLVIHGDAAPQDREGEVVIAERSERARKPQN